MELEEARYRKQQLLNAMMFPGFDGGSPSCAIGIRLTETNDQYRLAIFLTAEKDRQILNHPLISALLGEIGKDVDIEVIGVVKVDRPVVTARTQLTRPTVLRIGDSISNEKGRGGTLGFFAKRRSDSKCGIVSCNHVIARRDRGVDSEKIINPAKSGTAFALLDGNYPPLFTPGLRQVDAAFAAFNSSPAVSHDASTVDGMTLNPTAPTPVKLTSVSKVGMRTGLRTGTLKTFETSAFTMLYGKKKVMFGEVLQVISGRKAFSQDGDSGSLVFTTATVQPVGLLFAKSDSGNAWVFPLNLVTTALAVDLIVSDSGCM
jgi:hypothetical protein